MQVCLRSSHALTKNQMNKTVDDYTKQIKMSKRITLFSSKTVFKLVVVGKKEK